MHSPHYKQEYLVSINKNILVFLRKESSFDALYNILLLIIVCTIGYTFLSKENTIALGVGIILSCLTDLPGNRQDKISTSLWCIPIFAITSLLIATSSYQQSIWTITLLAIFGFVYTLISLFGFRVSIVGNLGLIVASFTIGLKVSDPIQYTLAFTGGCIIYFIFSLVFVHLQPYRSLRYAIEEGVINMSRLITAKVDCYDEDKNLNKTYRKLSIIHVQVSDKLEQIRSLLLREKQLIHSNHEATQLWLSKLYSLVDLYELLMGIDQDYETTRAQLKPIGALPLIRIALKTLADETSQINLKDSTPTFEKTKKEELQAIIAQLQNIKANTTTEQQALLSSIAVQLQQILNILSKIKSNQIVGNESWLNHSFYSHFVNPKIELKTLLKHLNFKSPIFLYAVRMSVLLFLAGWIGYILPEFRYASWIILTIILVARPTYNITQKRNFQRVIGSIIGILISVVVLLTTHNEIALLIITAIGLYLYFLFSRTNYLICVIFITIAIVTFQSIYEGYSEIILGSRFGFTLLGAVLAILGCLAIPINHFRTIKNQTQALMHNFETYLSKIQSNINSTEINFYELRLLRKSTQTALAQCYDALEQLEKEPRIGKLYRTQIQHFQSLAYRINALLIGVAINITKTQSEIDQSVFQKKLAFIQDLLTESQKISESLSSRTS